MTETPTNVTPPPDLTYGYVDGRIILAIGDRSDAGRMPDPVPADGMTVTFTPANTILKVASPTPATVIKQPITCTVDANGYLVDEQGARGVWLVTGTYKVTYSNQRAIIPTHDIEVTTGHTEVAPLDLTTAMPPGGPVLTPSEYAELNGRITILEAGGGGGGVTVHSALTGRTAADQHPTSAITGLDAALAGKATTAQGAKADTAVQPADLTAYATDADLSGHAADTTGVHGIADTAALVLTSDARLSDARTPTAHTHDDRYFTEAEADGRFVRTVNGTGPDGSGNVTVSGGGGGVTDHGALTGLADDDHIQYALADGTRGSFAAPLGADDNYVTDAEKAKLGNLSGTNTGDQTLPTWSTISGKPAVVAAGATEADARTAIGAGTSSLVVGTGAGDAKAGNYQPTAANISDSTTTGRAVLTAADAAAARTALSLGTAATTASTAYATAAQGAKADTALQVATAQPINAQTGAYTLVAGDAGKMVEMNLSAGAALNVPGSTFTQGQRIDVLDVGSGRVTFVGTSGMTLNGVPSLVSSAQWSAFSIFIRSATTAAVIGRLA